MNKPGELAALHTAAGVSRPHESAHLHVAGAAPYTDDLPELSGTLHCALGLSPVAHGVLKGIDVAALRALPGVVDVLTAADIPGENECGSLVKDDPILAGEAGAALRWLGQPVFAVIATTRDAARRAAAKARQVIQADALPPILTPQQAHAAGQYVVPPMHLARGDARAAIDAAPHRATLQWDVGGQEQFYLEGQISYAVPVEDGGVKVYCSTQHPARCSTWWRMRCTARHTRCTWSAGAWAAASAARNRSRPSSPAWRPLRR